MAVIDTNGFSKLSAQQQTTSDLFEIDKYIFMTKEVYRCKDSTESTQHHAGTAM